MQRRNAVPVEPYRYDVDVSLKGRRAWIKGERGVSYTIRQFETNPRNGKSWYVLDSDHGSRHIAPEDISKIAKSPKGLS